MIGILTYNDSYFTFKKFDHFKEFDMIDLNQDFKDLALREQEFGIATSQLENRGSDAKNAVLVSAYALRRPLEGIERAIIGFLHSRNIVKESKQQMQKAASKLKKRLASCFE